MKRLLILLLVALLAIGSVACGNNQSSADNNDTKSELFSGNGGWKEENLGVVFILEDDGSGWMINEMNSNGQPSTLSSEITWEEGTEDLKILTSNGNYILQKRKEGTTEILELDGVSYKRIGEAEKKEYLTKAEQADTNVALVQGTEKVEEIGASANSNWETVITTDAFGDITDNSETLVSIRTNGDFSNTATASSELSVVITVNPPDEVMSFELYEYGNTLATYIDSDEIQLQCKINDTISEFGLLGKSPNGALLLGDKYQRALNYRERNLDILGDRQVSGYNLITKELMSGNDVRCIITIGNSQYNFTIPSLNFVELCDKQGYTVYLTPEYKTAKALAAYLAGLKYDIENHYDGYTLGDGYDYIINGIGENRYEKPDASQYNEIFVGNFQAFEFASSGESDKVIFGDDGSVSGWDSPRSQWTYISVEDDYLCLSREGSKHKSKYTVYELMDKCYLLVNFDYNGKASVVNSYIAIKCNEDWSPMNTLLQKEKDDYTGN